MMQQSLGLGHKPNVIPPAEANINGEHRIVQVGWHPVAGLAGKWFAEQTGLGKMISENVKKYPDPTQHWAILVGDYGHQLWMVRLPCWMRYPAYISKRSDTKFTLWQDEHLDVIYINEKLKHEEWHTFEVGKTAFNDEALRQAGECYCSFAFACIMILF